MSDNQVDFLVVAAIDFGTARSGFGFAYTAKPDSIEAGQEWPGGTGLNLKTLTNILLDKKTSKYTHFGYEARDEYFDADEDEREDMLFFERFKMKLYEAAPGDQADLKHQYDDPAQGSVQDYMKSASGIEVPSRVVLREALKFMMHCIRTKFDRAQAKDIKVRPRDVMWVVTVPGMWRDRAKNIMRKAAEDAGMGTHHNLLLALEPEAASLDVRHEYRDLDQLPQGSKYIVVDCGGGTVDFACHEIMNDRIRETHPATGGPWGSTYLDKGYAGLLKEIFGHAVIEEYEMNFPAGWTSILDNWESAKIRMRDFERKCRVALPASFIEHVGSAAIRSCCAKYSSDVYPIKFMEGTLKLHGGTIKHLFAPMLKGIEQELEKLLDNPEVRDSQWLFVVGGFAESQILQSHLTDHFPNQRVVIPHRPGLSVIKGAVRYGVNPSLIAVRKARFTYGVKTMSVFLQGTHDKSKLKVINGQLKCEDLFMIYVKKGQDIGFDEKISIKFTAVHNEQKRCTFDIYTSEEERPMYTTDDSCTLVGQIHVALPADIQPGLSSSRVVCEMEFGGTEIKVTGSNCDGITVETVLDFLTQ